MCSKGCNRVESNRIEWQSCLILKLISCFVTVSGAMLVMVLEAGLPAYLSAVLSLCQVLVIVLEAGLPAYLSGVLSLCQVLCSTCDSRCWMR